MTATPAADSIGHVTGNRDTARAAAGLAAVVLTPVVPPRGRCAGLRGWRGGA